MEEETSPTLVEAVLAEDRRDHARRDFLAIEQTADEIMLIFGYSDEIRPLDYERRQLVVTKLFWVLSRGRSSLEQETVALRARLQREQIKSMRMLEKLAEIKNAELNYDSSCCWCLRLWRRIWHSRD